MKCPKCDKGLILFTEDFKGVVFNRKKVITYYCPICDFVNKKEFKINEDSYRAEINKKSNTKSFETIKTQNKNE